MARAKVTKITKVARGGKVAKVKEIEEPSKVVNSSVIPRSDPNLLIRTLQAVLGGEGVVIQRANEVEGRMDLRRPSGIPSLDIACGGGLPAGGLSQIDGPEGVGKNLLLNHYFAENQRIYGDDSNIFMLCLEFNYDKFFGRACGVQVGLSDYEVRAEGRRRHVAGEPTLHQDEIDELRREKGNFHIFRGSAAEKLLDGVVDAVRINSYQVGGIDSWDAMLTVADEEKDLIDAAKVADASGIQTRWMRKVQAALTPQKICPVCYARPLGFKSRETNYKYECPNQDCGWSGQDPYMWENETTLIGIRQVRANLQRATMRSREYKVGGAWALKHGKLIDIQLRRGEIIKDPKTDEHIAKEIHWEITKGKAGTHEGKRGTYSLSFDPLRINVSKDTVNYCLQHDIIRFEKKKWVIRHGGAIEHYEDPIVIDTKEMLYQMADVEESIRRGLFMLMLTDAGLGYVRHK